MGVLTALPPYSHSASCGAQLDRRLRSSSTQVVASPPALGAQDLYLEASQHAAAVRAAATWHGNRGRDTFASAAADQTTSECVNTLQHNLNGHIVALHHGVDIA